MRDPVIYRVAHMTHHNTGDKWCIYPMYDFAHPIEDAIEGVTHSICTLEFEDHRPLYDWVVRELEYQYPPKQIEFAKLYLTNVVTGEEEDLHRNPSRCLWNCVVCPRQTALWTMLCWSTASVKI